MSNLRSHIWGQIGAYVRVCALLLTVVSLLIPTSPLHAQSSAPIAVGQAPNAETAASAGYPLDLPLEIPWSAARGGWSDVVDAFNNARTRENALLGLTLPAIDLPAAAEWAALDDGAKTLWLINAERTARGLAPLQGLEANVGTVAQAYAEWLLAHNVFAHNADGRSPWERLHANPAIGACHDFLGIAENLYFVATTGDEPLPLVVEQAVYRMLYVDAGSAWGHRHAILWTPYTENSGAPDREGFLGIGHAHGGYTVPGDGTYYQHTDILVMNFFDPCATWDEPDAASPTPKATPPATPTPTPTVTVMPTVSPTPSASATPTPSATPTHTPRTVSGKVVVPPGEAFKGQRATGDVGLAGVVITSEDGQTTVTDEHGVFTLAGLSPEPHTLTPGKAGYVFAPPTIEVDLSTGDLSGIVIAGLSGPSSTGLTYTILLPLIMPAR